MQRNVDEAVEKLKAQGIDAFGIVCHVSNAQHRQILVQKTVQVRCEDIPFFLINLSLVFYS